jgi:translation initiation factor 3 subunit L
MIHVEETTVHRRTAAFFVRNAEQAQRTFNNIRSAPLPSAVAPQGQDGKDGKQGQRGPRRDGGKDQGEKKVWAPKSRQVRIAA